MGVASDLHQENFEGNKNTTFLTWPGLNNQQLLKHIPPIIATNVVHLDQ